jgi:membrane protein
MALISDLEKRVGNYLKNLFAHPGEEFSRWNSILRFSSELVKHGWRQLNQDRAPQMAAALAYRSLFSLIPVLVLGTILIRALGGFDELRNRLEQFFITLQLDQYQMQPPAEAETASEGLQSLSDWLLSLLTQVEDVDLRAITWVGVAVLIYSGIGLMVTIENSFNLVCRAPEGRSWARRLPIYWTVLTLGPSAIALTMFLSSRVNAMIDEHAVGWLYALRVLPLMGTMVVTWLVMLLLYKWVPNTYVALKPAMIGAAVATLLIEVGKRSLGAYLENAMSMQQLYGSLGLVPLFMFWVYLMWLVVLFGLEVCSTLQKLGGRRPDQIEEKKEYTGMLEPAAIVSVMQVIAEAFANGRAVGSRDIADLLSLPEALVQKMLDKLVAAGLVHRLEREDNAVSLARLPDQISGDQLMEIGFSLVDDATAAERTPILKKLREVQRAVAGELTLEALLAAAPLRGAGPGATAAGASVRSGQAS